MAIAVKKVGSVLVKLGLMGLLALMPTDLAMTQPVSVRIAAPVEAAEPDPFLVAELDRTLDRINAIRGKKVL